jgi:hypothetical protein
MRQWQRGPKKQERWEYKNGKHQPVLLERHVLREIMDRLWLQARVKVWQINQPVGGKVQQNVSGIPDLIGFIPGSVLPWNQNPTAAARILWGLPLFIEVKRPGGRRRFMQEQFIASAKEGGAIAFFAESWNDVIREFEILGIILKGEL